MAEPDAGTPSRLPPEDAPGARLEPADPLQVAAAREEQARLAMLDGLLTALRVAPARKEQASSSVDNSSLETLRVAPARKEQAPAKQRPAELIALAKEQLRTLTGYGIDSVAGFAKTDGGWHLAVTVVELHRIPAATDVLANYEVDLDEAGDIVSYHRGRRYFRDQVGDET